MAEAKVVFVKNSYDPVTGASFYGSDERCLDVDQAQRMVDAGSAVYVEELSALSKDDLKERASEMGVEVSGDDTKKDIVAKIEGKEA